MSARKFGASWWADFRVNGKRYRLRSPDNSKAGAQAYEATLRQKLARGETIYSEAKTDSTFAEFGEEWLRVYASVHNKASEIYNKNRVLRGQFFPRWAKKKLSEITTEEIEHFKAEKMSTGIKPKSVNNYLAILGKMLRSAVDWNRLDRMPKIKMLKCISQRLDFLTPAECRRLLEDKSDDFWHGMVLVAIRTGMRPGEIAALDWSDIDLPHKLITVQRSVWRGTVSSTKTFRVRHIPIAHDLLAWFQAQPRRIGLLFPRSEDGTHLGDCMRNKGLTALRERAGVRHFTWYTLRHTFATRLAASGVPITAIKELMGHANISMTMRYAHVSPSSLHNAVETLELEEKMPEMLNFGQQVGNAAYRGTQKIEGYENLLSVFSAQQK